VTSKESVEVGVRKVHKLALQEKCVISKFEGVETSRDLAEYSKKGHG
jgi:hypothetical protein